jgi:hypothetical protein
MAWFVPRLVHARRGAGLSTSSVGEPVSPADFDRLLDGLREVRIAVPCAGCGGAHEMTCTEILARQLIGGSGWTSEECDDGVTLASILSPEDVASCGGDPEAVAAILARRGVLSTLAATAPPHGAGNSRRMLLNY